MAKKKTRKKLPPDVVEKAMELLDRGGTLASVADACGIGLSTVSRIKKAGKKYGSVHYQHVTIQVGLGRDAKRLMKMIKIDLKRLVGQDFSDETLVEAALSIFADVLAERIATAVDSVLPKGIMNGETSSER